MDTKTIINGLDVDQLNGTVEAIKETPTLARFQWRARNKWIDGGENRTTIKDFYGAGAEDSSRSEPWEFVNGEPPVLLGSNEGAIPVEFLLHALAGCVTTTFVINAAARGINVESVSTTLEGDMDLQGFLGLDKNISPGYEAIRINMDIKADCSEAELEDLLEHTRAHSPVCQSVCRPVPVTVERVATATAR
jgi:uncharacterized OsmC-like protein